MRRAGNLFENIISFENLEVACLKAFKGRNASEKVVALKGNLIQYISDLRNRLLYDMVRFGRFRRFTIFEPKKREICAPDLEEMIVHHALMNVCHEIFERKYIFHSYASRPGKGIHKAVKTVSNKAVGNEWYLKMDIRKFYDSVDHSVLKRMLYRMFKDKKLLGIFYSIIDSYEVECGKGLPIGNLTSQYFANLYMSAVDHFMTENLKVRAYFRYMDDVVILDNDKERIKRLALNYIEYCDKELLLKVKPPCIGRTFNGLNFLGYRITPGKIKLNGKSKRRFRHKLLKNCRLNIKGVISDEETINKTQSLIAFTRHACSRNFRKSCLAIIENSYNGFMS